MSFRKPKDELLLLVKKLLPLKLCPSSKSTKARLQMRSRKHNGSLKSHPDHLPRRSQNQLTTSTSWSPTWSVETPRMTKPRWSPPWSVETTRVTPRLNHSPQLSHPSARTNESLQPSHPPLVRSLNWQKRRREPRISRLRQKYFKNVSV